MGAYEEPSASGSLALPTALDALAPHGFFAPVSRPALDELLVECGRKVEAIRAIAAQADGLFGGLLPHFLEGNLDPEARISVKKAHTIFGESGALASLYAAYWRRAIELTDVLEHMPQARRSEWHEKIRTLDTPPFDAETVIPTIRDLLHSRERFLAERVDGIFRNLSGKHVTNQPAGFSVRMIIAGLLNSYGSGDYERVGYINDLRCVIARFMGRDEPRWGATSSLVEYARRERRGEWLTVDGGALRLRAYMCGTAHLEVHPDMAWRLNAVLAMLHPQAIPPANRTPPRKPRKDFVMMGQPLPFAVLEWLERIKPACVPAPPGQAGTVQLPNTLALPYGLDQAVRDAVEGVLAALGGVKMQIKGLTYFEFGYPPARALREVYISGTLPDRASYQYYPTQRALAARAVEAAQIGEHDSVLEPSAGQGGLADLLPKDRTTCVELAALHGRILRVKGFAPVIERDFLEWAEESARLGKSFDRIVMNPPFSQGRAQLHFDAARTLLAPNGRLVAILPSGFALQAAPEGWIYEASELIAGAFKDASVSVVILVARRA